ncbi:MAG: 4Fe-4S dicluster domain-containing protein [Bacteroidales bacterium]|nr:4Fe-4S dicluster domain-containing protein [Bacteroidales bacterium]
MIGWFDTIWAFAAWILFIVIMIITVIAIIQSWIEREKRAAKRLFGLSIFLVIIHLFLFVVSPGWIGDLVFIIYVVFIVSFTGLLLAPWPVSDLQSDIESPERVDERTIMFSRVELEPDTKRFEDYYKLHPEHLTSDDEFRLSPGLLNKGSQFYHPFLFPAADASFFTVEALQARTDGPVSECDSQKSFEDLWQFIRRWGGEMGCHSIAVTRLKPEHLYTVGGRKHNYGQPVITQHTHAIVFTVEMDANRVASSPGSPIILESSNQYLHAGVVAVQIAAFLRNKSYSARAHIDGKYQVRCPQIARDAGLGEIGRMSLLMTPKLGPRVRIGVVTTNAALPLSEVRRDPSMIRFCRSCKKCADACPSQALSFSDCEIKEDKYQWSMSQEKCFNYWCKIGTDCGRCIAVCPFSHPNNFLHNVIRVLIRTSPLFSKFALRMDDWLYGRKPPSRELPEWMISNK